MEKMKKFLLAFLLIPFCFSFVACKDKSNESDGDGGNSDKNEIVSTESFSVSYDYNLPEKYDFLLTDYVDSGNAIGSSVQVATIPDLNLSKADTFLGWYNEDDELVAGTITSSQPTTIKLKAKWNEENIDKYYYSSGLTFEVSDDIASVSGYTGSASKIVLPKLYVFSGDEYSVSSINDSVFENKNITDVISNADELSIGDSVFKNTNLKSFDFEKVTQIGISAFENTKISEIKLSSGFNGIGEGAFRTCKNLTTVDFSSNEISISDYAFYECLNLAFIKNANNVNTIEQYAFAKCKKLTNTLFLGENTRITRLGYRAFYECEGIIDVFIPESVTTVIAPFDGCVNAETITLSRTYATQTNGSDSLINHLGAMSENVNKISFVGSSASKLLRNYFYGFGKLETFEMSDSIMYVEDYAFKYCNNLANVKLSNSLVLDDFSYKAFNGTKFLESMTEPWIHEKTMTILFVPQNIEGEYEIPEGVTRINEFAFSNRDKLTKIKIPSTVEYIGKSAFAGCSKLTDVEFAVNDKITVLEDQIFNQCEMLATINLNNLKGLYKIGNEVFRKTAFNKMVIPSTVTELGIGVFSGADVSSFEISGENSVFLVIDNVLYKDISEAGNESELLLYAYPKQKTDKIFVCPENVVEIASYAFASANNLKYVYFAQNLIEWEVSTNSTGEMVYTSFESTYGIIILRENTDLEINFSNVYVYSLVNSSDCVWNKTDECVEITNNFVPETEACFLRVVEENRKITIVLFEFDMINKIVIQDSIKVLSEILD